MNSHRFDRRRVLASMAAAIALPLDAIASATPEASARPVTFPHDDGPHAQPIEWWYYTGHLFAAGGDRYGFEFVVFKGKQRNIGAYASHFAITDNARGRFRYDQKIDLSPPDADVERDTGFSFDLGDWHMSGADGKDQLRAETVGYAVDLTLTSQKPPALHGDAGYIDYGEHGFTYYYSRTRIEIAGTLTVDGIDESVTGQAWFDHQWGDFTFYQEGGWDWYSVQLDDGTELMLYLIRDSNRELFAIDGSWVEADGTVTVLHQRDFTLTPAGTWTSPATGATYPSGWTVELPAVDLHVELTPSMPDQELDTTVTTKVIYWEGEVTVSGTRSATLATGLGYVELTGYAEANSDGAFVGADGGPPTRQIADVYESRIAVPTQSAAIRFNVP
jgi:predicted secreted hydrolase